MATTSGQEASGNSVLLKQAASSGSHSWLYFRPLPPPNVVVVIIVIFKAPSPLDLAYSFSMRKIFLERSVI